MRSAWLQEALVGEYTLPSLSGNARADVAIVGGGMTGLWTALHIKRAEPAARVVVLERDLCGSGASGRNAGLVMDWWAKLASFEKHCGLDGADRLNRAAAAAVDAIERFCHQFAPEAAFRRAGWLWGATNAAQLGEWQATLDLLHSRGKQVFREVDREEAVALSGSSTFLGGVFQASVGTVQPAQLTLALRQAALDAGVDVYEQTSVTEIHDGRPAKLRCPDGTVVADRVVLAMNCWLIRLKQVQRSMFVVGSDMASTEPVPELLQEPFSGGVGVTDSRMLLRYARTSSNGRVLVGLAGTEVVPAGRGRGVFEGVPSPARLWQLRDMYGRAYPEIAAKVPLTRSWTGPVDRSWTGVPFVDTLDPGGSIVLTGGYSGNGVGPSYLIAHMLASVVLDRDDDHRDLAAMLPARGGVPPEPLAYVGGRLVRAAVARVEAGQDAASRVGPLTRRLAALAPSGVVPKDSR